MTNPKSPKSPKIFVSSSLENKWQRSFPAGTVVGAHWILDVLEDLALYSEAYELDDIAEVLILTRDVVRSKLNEIPSSG